ncbi:glycosyltransferase family 4 protein [bacterium]|nr:glycosyltransferase family 4 protein [bacterium]
MDKKIAYIHGRLGPHIMHGRLAKSVNSEFHIVDQYKKWNDGYYNRLYVIYAWIYNAFAFKNPSNYDLFLVSGPHFSPIIMKFFRLKKKQKVFVHLGDETMYFLYDKWYGKLMQKVLIALLNKYDGLLCEGQMAADLARLNGINGPRIYTTYLGVPKERQSTLLKLQPNSSAKKLMFISTGPKGWRTYYKGLDLMIEAFSIAFEKDNELSFTIIGEWDKSLQIELLNNCSLSCKRAIHFIGHADKIDDYLKDGSIYYHTSRGDAFPTVVLEAMSAGLIPIVSNWTGSKEVVTKVDKKLIVSLDKVQIANKILEVVNLDNDEKSRLSQKSKEVSSLFTEEYALKHYQKTFKQIIKHFNL